MKNTVLPLMPRQLLIEMKVKRVIILIESIVNLLTCYSKTLMPFSFFLLMLRQLITQNVLLSYYN
jgi:hypothetical protein